MNVSAVATGAAIIEKFAYGQSKLEAFAGSPWLTRLQRLDPVSATIGGAFSGGFSAFQAGTPLLRGAGLGALAELSNPMTIAAAAMMAASKPFLQGVERQQQVNSSLSAYQFTNQNAFTGRGFSGEQRLAIGKTLRAFDANDAFVTFQDSMRMLDRFNAMGMGQGVRDAEAFSDKFKTMAQTVKALAKSMGTTMDAASETFGRLRSSGIYSSADVVGMSYGMRALQSGGMREGDVYGVVQAGAGISRGYGMRGSAGVKGATSIAEGLVAGAGAGVLSANEMMDMTGASDLSGAAAQISSDATARLTNFLVSNPAGRALLAVVGEQDSEGRYTGEASGSALAEVTNGTLGIKDLSRRGREKLGSKSSKLSYEVRNKDIAASVLEKDPMSVVQSLIGSLRESKPDMNEEDLYLYAMENVVGMDRRQAELFKSEFENMQKIRAQRGKARMEEIRRALYEQDVSQNHTVKGIVQKITGTFDDALSPLREAGASFYTTSEHVAENAIDRLMGRTRFTTDSVKMSTAYRPVTVDDIQGGAAAPSDPFSVAAINGDYAGIEQKLGAKGVARARELAQTFLSSPGMKQRVARYGQDGIGYSAMNGVRMTRGGMMASSTPGMSETEYGLALHYAGMDEAASNLMMKQVGAGGFAKSIDEKRARVDAILEDNIYQRIGDAVGISGDTTRTLSTLGRVQAGIGTLGLSELAFRYGRSHEIESMRKNGSLSLISAMKGKMSPQELKEIMQRSNAPKKAARVVSEKLGVDVTPDMLASASELIERTRGTGQQRTLDELADLTSGEQASANFANLTISLSAEGISHINSGAFTKMQRAIQAAGSGGDANSAWESVSSYFDSLGEGDITALSGKGPTGELLARTAMASRAASRATKASDLEALGLTEKEWSSWGVKVGDGIDEDERKAVVANIQRKALMEGSENSGGVYTATTERTMVQMEKEMSKLISANTKFAEQVTTLIAEKKRSDTSGGMTTATPGASRPEEE